MVDIAAAAALENGVGGQLDRSEAIAAVHAGVAFETMGRELPGEAGGVMSNAGDARGKCGEERVYERGRRSSGSGFSEEGSDGGGEMREPGKLSFFDKKEEHREKCGEADFFLKNKKGRAQREVRGVGRLGELKRSLLFVCFG